MDIYDNWLIYSPNIFFVCVFVICSAVVFIGFHVLRRTMHALTIKNKKKTDTCFDALYNRFVRIYDAIRKELLHDEN